MLLQDTHVKVKLEREKQKPISSFFGSAASADSAEKGAGSSGKDSKATTTSSSSIFKSTWSPSPPPKPDTGTLVPSAEDKTTKKRTANKPSKLDFFQPKKKQKFGE